MSSTPTNNIDVSVSFHQDRISTLKAQRLQAWDNGELDIYEAITQRIRENEEIIRELTTPQ